MGFGCLGAPANVAKLKDPTGLTFMIRLSQQGVAHDGFFHGYKGRRGSHTAESNHEPTRSTSSEWRSLIARGFSRAEDFVYLGLGILLAASAAFLLVTSVVTFGREALGGRGGQAIVELLDRLLLALMIVELLYTVQVHFREHLLAPEPFLIIGLIATLRRILVVTAEFSGLGEHPHFRDAMIELALLTSMVLVLVVSLRLLRVKTWTGSAAS